MNAPRTDDWPSEWTPEEVEEMLRRFEAADPEPRFELDWTTPYTLLVALVLAARAHDSKVNEVTKELFAEADTPQKMLALGEEALQERVHSLPFYRNKARNIIRLSEALVKEYGGEVPNDVDALTALPGVGRKTAQILRNVAFGEPVFGVDAHILRVANRTGLAPGKTPEEVEEKLERIIPERWRRKALRWLILHGCYVCTARKPKCGECIICDLCKWPEKRCAASDAA